MRYLSYVTSMPLITVTALCALILFVSLSGFIKFDNLRGVTANTIAPAVSTLASPLRAFGSFLSNATSFNEMRAELDEVRRENERLNEWFHTAQLLGAENQSLRALLNVNLNGHPSFLTTRLVIDPKSPYVKSALIAAGRNDGIEIGQAVIGENGLLGRVIEVFSKTSRILMTTDINSRLPVRIAGTQQKAILGGTNENMLELDYVPQAITVEKGMKIITSGDGRLMPAGLPVGEIVAVREKKIEVAPYATYEQSNYVRVLKLPPDEEERVLSSENLFQMEDTEAEMPEVEPAAEESAQETTELIGDEVQ
ncbi:MAG: rod shape-determining protein MreC [Micavibrio sp.]|nr:rod shape-determining protein MreC [Micavibrio sp.]|tara:strand:- start:742449 stop:743378 length:930 start_codon:yes stop_codon:yes gene_type:complete